MAHWRQVTDVFDGCQSNAFTGLTNWSFLFKKEDLSKRSMYGRAEFDLLKLRVLYQSKKSRDRKSKKKNNQGQQVGRLKKPKILKSGRNSQHTTTGISKGA